MLCSVDVANMHARQTDRQTTDIVCDPTLYVGCLTYNIATYAPFVVLLYGPKLELYNPPLSGRSTNWW